MESCLNLSESETMAVVRRRQCSACAGSGACLRCEGWGRVWSTMHGRAHCELCRDCSGVGVCKLCGGSGKSHPATAPGPFWRWRPAGQPSR